MNSPRALLLISGGSTDTLRLAYALLKLHEESLRAKGVAIIILSEPAESVAFDRPDPADFANEIERILEPWPMKAESVATQSTTFPLPRPTDPHAFRSNRFKHHHRPTHTFMCGPWPVRR